MGRLAARLGMLMVMVAALLALPAAAAQGAEDDSVLHSGLTIRAVHSGKCLDVPRGSHDDGVGIIQWDCHGGDNQRWRFVHVHDGFLIVNVNSGKCLDVERAGTANGTRLIQFRCHGGDNQVFRLFGHRQFEIKPLHVDKCLDIKGFSRRNGAPLILFHCNGDANQRFKIW